MDVRPQEARPVLCRKKPIAAANKVDHIASGSLPVKKSNLPESGRYHAGPSQKLRVHDHDTRNLNLFAPPSPVRASSAPRLRPEQSFRLQAHSPRDCRRKAVNPITPATISLAHKVPSNKVATGTSSWKRPSTSIFCGGDAPSMDERWTGRRPSPQHYPVTGRVLDPSEQERTVERRGHRGPRPRDHSVFGRLYDTQASTDNKPEALRTRIPPFTFDTPPTPRPSTNPRHVVSVPQPSTIFGNDHGVGGLCFWDYKFSSIQKPMSAALVNTHGQRRAATPEPRRQVTCDLSVQRSGKRRVLPPYLLA